MRRKYLIVIEKELHDWALQELSNLVGKKDFSKIVETLIFEKKRKRAEKLEKFTYNWENIENFLK